MLWNNGFPKSGTRGIMGSRMSMSPSGPGFSPGQEALEKFPGVSVQRLSLDEFRGEEKQLREGMRELNMNELDIEGKHDQHERKEEVGGASMLQHAKNGGEVIVAKVDGALAGILTLSKKADTASIDGLWTNKRISRRAETIKQMMDAAYDAAHHNSPGVNRCVVEADNPSPEFMLAMNRLKHIAKGFFMVQTKEDKEREAAAEEERQKEAEAAAGEEKAESGDDDTAEAANDNRPPLENAA